jgi:hypothetical protein
LDLFCIPRAVRIVAWRVRSSVFRAIRKLMRLMHFLDSREAKADQQAGWSETTIDGLSRTGGAGLWPKL